MLFSPLLERAVELAAEWHDGTYRKNRWREAAFDAPEAVRVPTMAHLTAVALLVQRAGFEDEVVAAAFLHDLVEDRNRHGDTFPAERLPALVGERVAALVRDVTEPKTDADGVLLPWRTRKDAYLAHLRSAPPESLALSLADKLHNVWTMNQALEQRTDIFRSAPGRTGLSAGPAEQAWFYRAVLEASAASEDARLVPLRERLAAEIERFERLLRENA